MKRKFRVLKAKGGKDASRDDFGPGPSGPDPRGPAELGITTKQKGLTKDKGSNNRQKIEVNKGPFQVPSPFNYTITGQIINRFSKSRFDAKNLKEARKNDVLGGEMLTKGKTIGPKNLGGDGQDNQIIKKKVVQPIEATKPIDQSLINPKDNFFNFKAYNVGGLSGGVSYGPPPKRGPNPQVPPVKMKRGGYKK